MIISTLIGSMPHKDPSEALDLIFKNLNRCPLWPQLPKKSFKENMYFQFSENFPGIFIEEGSQKIFVKLEDALNHIENYLTNYLESNIDFFSISEKFASGFHNFLNYTQEKYFENIKIQTIGPITFGLAIKTEFDQPIFYDQQLREIVVRHIVMKSIWQLQKLFENKTKIEKIILFLDEPYLAAYGSAFTSLSKKEIIDTLETVINEIKNNFIRLKNNFNYCISLQIGIHCCANTDWSILTELPLDIISFDAYEYFETILLYSTKINDFLKKGSTLSFGIIPNNENIYSENLTSIKDKLNNSIARLRQKNIDVSNLLDNLIITPQCGLGNCSIKLTQNILQLCNDIEQSLFM